MTVRETIESDRTVFLNVNENPNTYSMVHTPKGGVAQTAVTVMFKGVPLHGDEFQDEPVDQPDYTIVGKPADLSSIEPQDSILISGVTYEAIGAAYPDDTSDIWSVIDLRLPKGQETLI